MLRDCRSLFKACLEGRELDDWLVRCRETRVVCRRGEILITNIGYYEISVHKCDLLITLNR